MIIDCSAIVAILQDEPEARPLTRAIEDAETRRISVATLVEASLVTESRRGAAGVRDLDRLVSAARIEIVPVDVEQGQAARIAFSRFGRGRHKAALNFGDCFAYALATVLGEPLLFKGGNFRHTDVLVAETSA